MECLWLEDKKISVKNVPPPTPTKEEALIRLLLAGICRTDIEMQRGYYPFTGVPGHEFVGEVMHAPGDSSWEGKRVVGEINLACGECTHCRKGRPNHCEIRTVLGIVDRDGVFAESFTLPLANLHEVPKSVPDEAAVFAEPLAAACQILEQVRVRTTDVVLVIGAGKLGQLVARTLHRTGCALQVAAKHQRQKQLLADCGIAAMEPSQVSSGYANLVVEASGTPEGLDLARQAVRPLPGIEGAGPVLLGGRRDLPGGLPLRSLHPGAAPAGEVPGGSHPAGRGALPLEQGRPRLRARPETRSLEGAPPPVMRGKPMP